MKQIYLVIISLCFSLLLQAQVSKTIKNTAGNLDSLLTEEELNTITDLTITGTIDARDFKTMYAHMPVLAVLDMSKTIVISYWGIIEGLDYKNDYSADAIPQDAFPWKLSLQSVLLPSSITAIGNNAFEGCNSLTSIVIPSSVSVIGNSVFQQCGALTILSLPSSLTTIGNSAFTACSALTSLSIPSSVSYIGYSAFYQCSSLTEIELPLGVSIIEPETFEYCSSLTSIIIPSTVTAIGAHSFSGCNSLTSIRIPSSITKIKEGTFSGCSALITIELPPSVTSIDPNAFAGCSSLESINIPYTVSFIGNNAFAGCSSLQSVSIPSAITTIEAEVFYGCSALTAIHIPSSVTSIGSSAFRQCENLVSISIPSSVNDIGQTAFGDCPKLSSIYSYRSVPVEIEPDHFYPLDMTACTLHVPLGSESRYAEATEWKDFTTIVGDASGLGVSTDKIQYEANGGEFELHISANVPWQISSDQSWLKITPASGNNNQTITVTAEANTTSTNRDATITVTSEGEETQTIGVSQKSDPEVKPVTAGNLQLLLTEEEIKSMTSLALSGTINAHDIFFISSMPSLISLDISQTSIVGIQIENMYYPGNMIPGPSISKNSMNTCGHLSSATLKTIKLPSAVCAFGCGAFYGGLFTSFTIPPSVTTIGWEAFCRCSALESITIPSTVTFMDQWAFSFCTGLKEVIFEDGFKYIPRGTFTGCSSLTSVTLPASVTGIEMDAFNYATSLATIYSFNPIPPSARNAFFSVDKSTCTVYVPVGSKSLYAVAEEWKDFTNIVEMAAFAFSDTTATVEATQGSTTTVELIGDAEWTAATDQPWLTISPASGHGTQTLTFTAEANTTDSVRTALVIISGEGTEPQTLMIKQAKLITGVAEMTQNRPSITCYPNPFTNEMAIEIQNLKKEKITVDIYNISGQRVKNLTYENKAEQITLSWDGSNEQGQKVVPGMYICKMNEQSKQLIYKGH